MNTYQRRYLSRRDRFESFVTCIPECGCWLWGGAVDNPPRLAYGKFWDGGRGRSIVAHRASWEIYKGPIPDGMLVLHRCDIPECVNPSHLFLGTNFDNTRDMIVKGRNEPMLATRRGTQSNWVKLTPEQVLEIRMAEGLQRDIAARYSVTPGCVARIKRRLNWKHL